MTGFGAATPAFSGFTTSLLGLAALSSITTHAAICSLILLNDSRRTASRSRQCLSPFGRALANRTTSRQNSQLHSCDLAAGLSFPVTVLKWLREMNKPPCLHRLLSTGAPEHGKFLW